MWAIIAFTKLGFGDKAVEYYRMINPIEHSRTKDAARKYKVEPYTIPADVYGANNLANYKNETVLNVMKEVKNITEQNVLEEKHKELVNIVKDECPYISLYRNRNTLIINQNLIGNFEPTNYGIYKNFESWNKQ